MRRSFVPLSLSFAAIASALAPSAALAGQCDGSPGFTLTAPDTVEIGATVDLLLDGPSNEMGLLMVSLGQGPLKSPYGTLCLDFPLVAAIPFSFDASGHLVISGDIPCDPLLVDLTFYLQFITCKPNKGASNQEAVVIDDALHVGDLCTYTQGGWGSDCQGSNPGCLRDTWFAGLFQNGLRIGDVDGPNDGDSVWAARWDSSAALNKFLPIGGNPGALTADAVDPKTLPACIFAGQLVAARLNVVFDDAGVFDAGKCRDDLKLGDLIFVSGVDSDLIGWSVRDLLDLCDLAISGALGAGPFDIDGNGTGDVTFADLNNALDALNRNFDNCTNNLGYLGIP